MAHRVSRLLPSSYCGVRKVANSVSQLEHPIQAIAARSKTPFFRLYARTFPYRQPQATVRNFFGLHEQRLGYLRQDPACLLHVRDELP
jgi:hypothetical protein